MTEKKKQLEVYLTSGCVGIYCFMLMFYCGLNSWIRDVLQINPSIFSIVALVFLLSKIAITKYNFKEMVMIAIGMVIAGLNLLNTRDVTVLTNIIVICSVKNVNMEKALKWMFWGGVFVTGLVILTSLSGGMPPIALTQDFGREVGIETRYCLGFYHPNHLHWQIVQVALLAIAADFHKLDWKMVSLFAAINIGAYMLTGSRTGLICGMALCVIVMFYRMAVNVINMRIWKIAEMIVGLVLVGFSFLSAWCYKGTGLLAELNSLLNNRIIIANNYVNTIELSWWGYPGYSSITTENGYIRMLFGLGIVPCVVLICLELLLLLWALRNNRSEVRIVVLLTLAYGFMEPIGFLKVFKNIAFLYVGMMMFDKMSLDLIADK